MLIKMLLINILLKNITCLTVWQLFDIFLQNEASLYCHSSLHKKMNSSVIDFLSNCDQVLSFLRIWSHLLKNSLMENS